MKKIAALGLAGLMGVSALAMTAGTASADPGGDWWKHRHDDHHWNGDRHWDGDHHWNGGGGWGWGGPFVLGLGLGTMYGYGAAPYPDYGYGGGWDAHVRWCESQYRTYSPATDTFFIRPGVPARCIAPFDR